MEFKLNYKIAKVNKVLIEFSPRLENQLRTSHHFCKFNIHHVHLRMAQSESELLLG